jgi:hypothetical protein
VDTTSPRPPAGAWGRRVLWGLPAAVALVVHIPALGSPFLIDDYAHQAMADGHYPGSTGPWALYDFIQDSNRAALIDRGVFPWWTDPRLVVRFFRPVPSALLWIDHRLFGSHAFWPHVHSLLWWALAVAAVHALLRSSFSQRVARIGALVFAMAPCHALPVTWLANREVLVSAALGTMALCSYARWREGRRARDGLSSFALFAVAMAAGEYTLCYAGYVLAIELVHRRESLARRAIGLTSFALPAAGYLVLRAALHYGAHGAGFYHDPLSDFRAYASGAPHRAAVLVATAWLGLNDSGWALSIGWTFWSLAIVLIALVAVLSVPIARTLHALDREPCRRAAWMLLGSVLSLAPVLAVEPGARLLAVSMVGVSAVVALILDHAWSSPIPRARRGAAGLTALVALGLAFGHLVRAPVNTVRTIRKTQQGYAVFAERMAWVRERAVHRSTVVVVRAVSPSAELFAPFILDEAGDVRWRALTYASEHSILLRTGARSIELVARPGPLFPVGPQDLFRDFDRSLRIGDTVALEGMRVTVLQLDDHEAPRRLRFEFDEDLDDPSMLWITERVDGFREQRLPEPGYGEPVLP